MSAKFIRLTPQRIEPRRQHLASNFARRRPERARLLAHLARIDAGLAELDGVADEPAFEPRRLGLQMKLQRELRRRAGERLHRTMRRRGETLASRRQLAIVAVPVQHRRGAERRQHRSPAGGRQRQRRPADLLDRTRRHPRAKRRRHHLRAEADAEDRLVGFDARGDRGDFAGDERIGFALIDADRTAEHDDEIGRDQRLRVERLDAGIVIANLIAARGDQRAEQTEILEGDVANRQAGPGCDDCAPPIRPAAHRPIA